MTLPHGVFGLLLIWTHVVVLSSDEAWRAPGTVRMSAVLAQALKKSNPVANPYLNQEAADYYGRRIQALSEFSGAIKKSDLISLFFNHAVQLLKAGRNREAIAAFDRFQTVLKAQDITLFPDKMDLLHDFITLCYLRMGEQENCLALHSSESCLLPIQGSGVHELREGSLGAVRLLMERLKDQPGDRKAVWLLNLAHMTLGQYPEQVPPRWLIPSKAFASEQNLPAFNEVAAGSGLDVNALAGGVIIDDFDNDGDLDLIASSWGIHDPLRYFEHQADGSFLEKSNEAGLSGLTGGLNLNQADYDNDGHLDFLVLRGAWFAEEGKHPNSLIRNLGSGKFEDVTLQTGLLSFHPTQTAAWGDFNNDGYLDLFIGNESTEGSDHPCELYINQGNGRFVEAAKAAGVDFRAYVKGVAAGDFDNDGRLDLYISCRGEANVLYHNQANSKDGIPEFVDVAASAGVIEPMHSFPTWFFDVNNDGFLDLFVAGYKIQDVGDIAADVMGLPNQGTPAKLYMNNGDGTFQDATIRMGLNKVLHAMGANFGDLNLDGYPDFYLGTGDPDLSTIIPNRMFLNNEGQSFFDVTTAGRFGHLQKGHGISFADLDQDGDQDVYAVMGGAYSGDRYMNALFENPGFDNDWLGLQLVGTRCNRSSIGSRVKIRLSQGQNERIVYGQVTSGGSFGASPLRQQIGLGSGWDIESVEVSWAGELQWIRAGEMVKNKFYRILQGNELTPEKLAYPPLPFGGVKKGATHQHHSH